MHLLLQTMVTLKPQAVFCLPLDLHSLCLLPAPSRATVRLVFSFQFLGSVSFTSITGVPFTLFLYTTLFVFSLRTELVAVQASIHVSGAHVSQPLG